jgi:glycogen synthase
MRILMISSEGPPLIRSGALADVLEALPRELKKRGHEVALALPFYREIRTNPRNEVRTTRVTIKISLGRKKHAAEILECFTPTGLQVFLIKCDEFLIARNSTPNMATLTRTMPHALFFSAKQPSRWRGA